MKKVIELLLCNLHPIAVVLIWINWCFEAILGLIARLTWGIAAIVPFVRRVRSDWQRLPVADGPAGRRQAPRPEGGSQPGTTCAGPRRGRSAVLRSLGATLGRSKPVGGPLAAERGSLAMSASL